MRKLIVAILILVSPVLKAQQKTATLVYKTIDTTELKMHVHFPANYTKEQKWPAIVLFFGGGWISGSVKQLEPQAKHFASLGLIAITADYRVSSRQKTSPFDAVRDAKSAIRFLHLKAKELGIDTNRIVACGASAGGHIAAAADLTLLDEKGEDLRISSRPNALVLFNPVFNNGPGEYGYERIGENYKKISPFHNLKRGAAPAIVFFGTKDQHVSVTTAKLYQKTMRNFGSRCDLFLYEGQKHGFFNYQASTANEYFNITMAETDKFLKSLKYIE